MNIIAHICEIDQPQVGSDYAHWYSGDEIRIAVAHIAYYYPCTIYLKKKQKKPKTATQLYLINNKRIFLYESPAEIDNLYKCK